MASLNKVLLIGNLGRDPEVRYMSDGSAVCNFSIATTETWKDKNSGQKQEKTEWHNIVLYRRLAEVAGQYLKKGSQVYIEGRLQTRKWQDKTTGADRYTTEILADEMKMLGGGTRPAADSQPPQQPNGQRAPAPQKPQSFDDFEDDIPFDGAPAENLAAHMQSQTAGDAPAAEVNKPASKGGAKAAGKGGDYAKGKGK